MKQIVFYINTEFSEKLIDALNYYFVAFTFYSVPSQSRFNKQKIVLDTETVKIHQEVVEQITVFCEGFLLALTDDF